MIKVNITCHDCQLHKNTSADLPMRHETICPTCGSIWSVGPFDSNRTTQRSTGAVRTAFSTSTVCSTRRIWIIVGCVGGLVACLALTLTMSLLGWFFAGVVFALVTELVMLPLDTDPSPIERSSTSRRRCYEAPVRERFAVTSLGLRSVAVS
jgi:hypothetical protein